LTPFSKVDSPTIPTEIAALIELKNEKLPASLRTTIEKTCSFNIVQSSPNGDRWQAMYELAKLMGARQYIAVDKYWPNTVTRRKSDFSIINTIKDPCCDALFEKADTLNFLARLKD
jgi:hypothetical protein